MYKTCCVINSYFRYYLSYMNIGYYIILSDNLHFYFMAGSIAPTTTVTYHKFESVCFNSSTAGHIRVSLTIFIGEAVHWKLKFL